MLPGSRSQGLHADSNSKTRQLRGNISETSFYGSGGVFQERVYRAYRDNLHAEHVARLDRAMTEELRAMEEDHDE